MIYPFIIGAVRSTGITHGDEKKTGYYAGVIVGLPVHTHRIYIFTTALGIDFFPG